MTRCIDSILSHFCRPQRPFLAPPTLHRVIIFKSSPSGESSSSSAAAAAARSPWTARSTAGSHRRSSPSPCPKPPQPHQLLQYQRCFTGMPMPSPPPRQGAAQSPAPQGVRGLLPIVHFPFCLSSFSSILFLFFPFNGKRISGVGRQESNG